MESGLGADRSAVLETIDLGAALNVLRAPFPVAS